MRSLFTTVFYSKPHEIQFDQNFIETKMNESRYRARLLYRLFYDYLPPIHFFRMLRLQMILELPKFRELFPAELTISVGLFALLLLVDVTDVRGDVVAVEEAFVTDAAFVVAFASV
jgi:hypothetical protein